MTPSRATIAALNRLLTVLSRSLPMYLADATPWAGPDREKAARVLSNIVRDQRDLAARIGELIHGRRGEIALGPLPDFTILNDLEIDFLVGRLIERQQRDVAAIEEIVRDLSGDAEARALAEEALGAARAHLEMLEELQRAPAGA
ncbi:MAG: hypothetical protein HYS13_01065 [Planctomycetia bacterium]|nr:hypothetical protein [Planctomycetia bacterium]